MEQAEQDPDLIALSRQFKATAMELISVLEQVNNLSRTLHIYLLVSDSKSWLVPQFTEKIENSMVVVGSDRLTFVHLDPCEMVKH